MCAHTASSSGRSLAHRFALSLLLLAPAGCDSQPVDVPRAREPALRTLPASSTPGAQERRAGGNPVVRWNAIASELMVDPGPVMDGRAFAILHGAMHDAVNGVERRYAPYTADLSAPGASLDAAVATAAYDVIVALSPSTRQKTEREYASALASIPDGPARTKGVDLGRRAARANLDRRAGDEIPVGAWPPQTGPIT
jgi:hypothetical protein